MVQSIRVCQATSCSSNGATSTLRDIEELVNGQCNVEEWGCLGRCGMGPNVEVVDGSATSIHQDITSFKKVCTLLREEADLELPSNVKALGKLKYKIRREEDAKKREELMAKAFETVGGENSKSAGAEPMLLGSLLVIRAKDALKTNPAKALEDLQRATKLTPTWAQPWLILAQAFEVSGRAVDGVSAMKTALEIGKGFNVGNAKRQLTRLERKAKEEPTPVAAPAPAPAASAPKKASSKSTAKARAKSSSSGEKKEAKEKKEKKEASSPRLPPPPPVEEEIPEFLVWHLDGVSMLNHDCLRMTLHTDQMHSVSRQPEVSNIWHVDLLKEGEFGDELQRSYTPVSNMTDYRQGKLELMIKVYPKGNMTQHVAKLKPDSTMLISAPHTTLQPSEYKGMVMVAGGSAVTVAIQACRAVLEHHEGAVPVHLVLCNQTARNVLYVDVFDKMLADFPTFHVVHCVSNGDVPEVAGRQKWQVGRISTSVLESTEPELKCVVSGPMGLCHATSLLWQRLGRSAESLKVLDELPPPGSKQAEEAAAKIAPPEPEPVQEDMEQARKSKRSTASVQFQEPVAETEPTESLSFFQRLLLPWTICRGRGLEEDDGEGTSGPILTVH